MMSKITAALRKIKDCRAIRAIVTDKRKRIICISAFALVIAVIVIFTAALGGDTDTYEYQADSIKRTLFSGTTAQTITSDMQKSSPSPIYAVFISVSDGKNAAKVATGTGSSLTKAWNEAYSNGKKAVRRFNINTKWVRADIVNTVDAVTPESLKGKYLKSAAKNDIHYGISFSDDYKNAVLAEELNSNELIDYDNGSELSLDRLNAYLKTQKKPTLEALPSKLRVFTTRSFIFKDSNVSALTNNTGDSDILGTSQSLTKAKLENTVVSLTKKLTDSISDDGCFTYYLNPLKTSDTVEDYTVATHSKTISALAQRYRAIPNKELKKSIDRTLPYLLKCLAAPEEASNTAFARNGDHHEVYLGDTALAVIALADYIDISAQKSVEAEDALVKLGNGIMTFMEEESGVFEHTLLYPSLEPDDCFRDETYNALATYAMCRIYEVTGDQEWIDSAATAGDRLVSSSSIQSINKWYVLSLEKLGELTGNNTYYAAALNYVNDSITEIAGGDVCTPEYLDLLISAYNIFIETDNNEYVISETQDFDSYAFSLTLSSYVNVLFNRCFSPENAMYFDNADELIGNFFSAETDFISSAETVQGYLNSLSLYYSRFQALSAMYSKLI